MSIVLQNISKAFDGKLVLGRFNAVIDDGTTVCIMGASGSGKTTLLNLLCGITNPDTGSISGLVGKKTAVVFQDDRLAENLTVYRNLRLVISNKMTKALLAALAAVGLPKECLHEKIAELSGGMKRRVCILRALLSDSDFLLLDEPTKGLDDVNKNLTVRYIKENTRGKTVIWVTHDEAEAHSVSERILRL